MKLRAFCLDFTVQGGIIFPRDAELHKLAVEFCANELAKPINFADFGKVLLACEVNDEFKPLRVVGIACEQDVPDWPVLHFIDEAAGPVVFDRMRAYLQDRNYSGGLTFLHVARHESEETRCPSWRKFLRELGAKAASRWQVRV